MLLAYDEMLEFLSDCDWGAVEGELQGRGVKALTFYDIVLDFILMDAFDDLESPPSSVTAVVQNRWLSNGFKESVSKSLIFLRTLRSRLALWEVPFTTRLKVLAMTDIAMIIKSKTGMSRDSSRNLESIVEIAIILDYPLLS